MSELLSGPNPTGRSSASLETGPGAVATPAAALTAEPPILRARGLVKRYRMGRRLLEVLRGVDLVVPRGAFLALRGASGAGKSTLLHLLGGLDVPDAGEIWFQGQNLAALPETALTRLRNRHIGFVFQAYHLLPELDALENVCLPARIARLDAATAVRRGRELLARVGLADRMEHKPTELSGGEQQRVAIARALINEPDLILADEPTGNLDSHTGEEILRLLMEIRRERQVTLVMATHDHRVAAHAPMIVDLVDGQIHKPGAMPSAPA
ncbi:MAG: ABC transporter ATP-binding protein [Limisphaera sp.]